MKVIWTCLHWVDLAVQCENLGITFERYSTFRARKVNLYFFGIAHFSPYFGLQPRATT